MIGLCVTLILASLLPEITYVVEGKERKDKDVFGPRGAYAQAYGLFNCAFAGGALVGPIWGGFIVTKAGWATMAWSIGVLSIVTAVPAVS